MEIPSKLGELQTAVLRSLWSRGEASAHEIHADLLAEREIAFTTVATVLSRLEKKHGIVAHRTEGRTYIYHALVGETDLQESLVRAVVDRAFGGSAAALVSHLLSSEAVSEEELERVRAMIATSERNEE